MSKINLSSLLLAGLLSLSAGAAEINPEGLVIDLSGGLGMLSSKVEGEGLNGTIAPTSGIVYGGALSYWLASGLEMGLSYSRLSVSLPPASSNTAAGRSNAVRSAYGFTVMQAAPSDSSMAGFRFGLGYSMIRYSLSDSSIMGNQNSSGLSLLVDKSFKAGEHSHLVLNFELYAPNNFREDVASGYNPQMLGLELGAEYNYRLKEDLSVYLGASYRRENTKYTGAGEGARSIVSGLNDTRTIITVPVGIRWNLN